MELELVMASESVLESECVLELVFASEGVLEWVSGLD